MLCRTYQLITLSALAALAACGSGARMTQDSVVADGTQSGESGDGNLVTVKIPYSADMKVRIKADGRIDIVEAPFEIGARIAVQSLASPVVSGAFGMAGCAQLKANYATQYQSQFVSVQQKQVLKNNVRLQSTFTLRARLNPIAPTQALLTRISQAASAQGAAHPSYYFGATTEYSWSMASAEFKADGLTTVFGEQEDLVAAFGNKLAAAMMPSGEAVIEVSEYDLMCDLLNGKIVMHAKLDGKTEQPVVSRFDASESGDLGVRIEVGMAVLGAATSPMASLVVLTEALRYVDRQHELTVATIVELHAKLFDDAGSYRKPSLSELKALMMAQNSSADPVFYSAPVTVTLNATNTL